MAKDQKGHGSNKRGGGMVKVSVKRPIGYTVHGIGPGGKKTLTHSGTLGTVDGKTVNSRDSKVQDRVAADALSSGGPKSAPAPIHDSMTDARVKEAVGAMGRLRDTFRVGDNRHGEYGRNVREAHDRHAKLYAQLTGKKAPNIYD